MSIAHWLLYNIKITIKVTFRPTQELYTILDVEYDGYDNTVGYLPRIAPEPNNARHQLWRFLQQPLDDRATQYQNTTEWIGVRCTFDGELRVFK